LDWSYVAGLYDGEGSSAIFSRVKKHRFFSCGIAIQISGQKKHLDLVKNFLNSEGIKCGVTILNLQIQSFDSVKLFISKVVPYIILKKPQLEIMSEAVALRDNLKLFGKGAIVRNSDAFDKLRHRLHAHSRKGPRELKEWPKPIYEYMEKFDAVSGR